MAADQTLKMTKGGWSWIKHKIGCLSRWSRSLMELNFNMETINSDNDDEW